MEAAAAEGARDGIAALGRNAAGFKELEDMASKYAKAKAAVRACALLE